MQKTAQRAWLGVAIASSLFVGWTVAVKLVDVGVVGLQHGNGWWLRLVGTNPVWDLITDLILGATLLLAMFLVLAELWRRRSGWTLVTLGLLVAVYCCFELVVINVRPDGSGASYPSSHVLVFCTVLPMALGRLWRCCGTHGIKIGLSVVLVAMLVLGVVGRALCGLHWLSDIVGGILGGLMLTRVDLALTFQ